VLRKILSSIPNVRGRQRALLMLDFFMGSSRIAARHGVQLEGYYSSAQDLAFCRRESDNPLLEELIASLPKDGVFIDCGANCGFYSSFAARMLESDGFVISFEPSAREYRRLQSAVKWNNHQCTWLTLHQAVGESSEVVSLLTAVGHTGMNRISNDKSTSEQTSSVWMTSVDSIVSEVIAKEKAINLVKIDVEGYEMNVLRGLSNCLKEKRIDKMVVEVTDKFLKERGESKQSMIAYMKSFSYEPTIESDEWQYDEVFVKA